MSPPIVNLLDAIMEHDQLAFVQGAVEAALPALTQNKEQWNLAKMGMLDETFAHFVKCVRGLPKPDNIDLSFNRLTTGCFESLTELLGGNQRCMVKLHFNFFTEGSVIADTSMVLFSSQLVFDEHWPWDAPQGPHVDTVATAFEQAAFTCVRATLGDGWVPAENHDHHLKHRHVLWHIHPDSGRPLKLLEHDGMFVCPQRELIVWHEFQLRVGQADIQKLPTRLASFRDWLSEWENRLREDPNGDWTRSVLGRPAMRLPKALEGAAGYRIVFFVSFIVFKEEERIVRRSISNSNLDIRLLPMGLHRGEGGDWLREL
jgi:hypothetical protein